MRIAGSSARRMSCCLLDVVFSEATRSGQPRPLKVEGVQPWDTWVMATRDEIHRLLDGVPDDRVAAIGEILRAALEAGLTGDQAHRLAKQLRVDPDLTGLAAEPVRSFASAGTLSAEPDLAERSEEILRTEPPGTAA